MIVVSTHFDDGIGSCAGTLLRCREAGVDGRLLTVMSRPTWPPFVKHLLRNLSDWRPGEPFWIRAREDHRACLRLGIRRLELGCVDALYRTDDAGRRLYPDPSSLNEKPHPRDDGQIEAIAVKIEQLAARIGRPVTDGESGGDSGAPPGLGATHPSAADNILAFPMAIGMHVDHQLCARAGLSLLAKGHPVLFYRDFFYQGAGIITTSLLAGAQSWQVRLSEAELARKIEVFEAYASQIGPLYGSIASLRKSLRTYEATEDFLVPHASLPHLRDWLTRLGAEPVSP